MCLLLLSIILSGQSRCIFAAQNFANERYYESYNAYYQPERLIDMMRTYYIDAEKRLLELNSIRFLHEESPHYEQGYVFGEIIERYKKIVEHMRRITEFKTCFLYEVVDRIEQMHRLYFEVKHLVNMMHEIKRKYKNVPEFFEKVEDDIDEEMVLQIQQGFYEAERQRIRERKQRLKNFKKQGHYFITYNKTLTSPPPGAKPSPYNNRWPLDYGWDNEKW